MQGVLDNIAGLENMTSSANLEKTGVHENPLCKADFRPDARIVCAGDTVNFTDISYHNVQNRTWIFHGGDPFFSLNESKPSIRYPNPGLYDVDLKVEQGNDSLSVKKEELIRVLDPIGDPTPYIEDMEVDPIEGEKIFPTDGYEGSQWGHTDRTGASGHSALLFENYLAEEGETYSFETRSIDASSESAIALSFKVAYREKDADDQEQLKVYANKGCSEAWSLRKVLGSDQLKNGPPKNSFYDAEENGAWKTFTVIHPLSFGYNTEGLRFKFSFFSDGGNNIYIDDINVAHPDELSLNNRKAPLNLEVYPNPTEEELYIRAKGTDAFEYSLKDATGRTLLSDKTERDPEGHREELAVGDLSSGIYFLHIRTDEGVEAVRKIVVR
jgi:PKD repeat protein